MKKSLLAMLMLGAASVASAQALTDYFTVSYHDEVINEGDIVYVTDRIDEGDGLGFSYLSHIKMVNKTNAPMACFAVFQYNNPTQAEIAADSDFWGMPSMCYSGAEQINGAAANSCLAAGKLDAGRGYVWVPEAGKDNFSWEPHLDFANGEAVSYYTLMIVPMIGDSQDFSELEEGDPFTFQICYCAEKPNGIEGVTIDSNDAPKYYDLQGRRIDNPAKGLYIRVANGKALKVIL